MSNDTNTIDIAAEVQSAIPAVIERMRATLNERISREAESVAMDEVRKTVREWTAANLVPELIAQLDAGKEAMFLQAHDLAKKLGQSIGEAMAAQADKSLQSQYVVKDIAEKLFRGY